MPRFTLDNPGPRRRPAGPWRNGPIPVIGVIGGIGAGKSQVASMFAGDRRLLLDADQIGHVLLEQSPSRANTRCRISGRPLKDSARSRWSRSVRRRRLALISVLPFLPRLQMQLRETFYGSMIDVVNRGIGGEEALDGASRFECDVIAEAPALVIWQVGTNAVFHDTSYCREDVAKAIAAGLRWLAGLPMDVVLMDLQYTKALVCKIGASTVPKLPLSEDMVSRIAAVAEGADPKVNVFRRFALMRRWVDAGIPLDSMDDQGNDRLHTSKWATDCVARALSEAIINSPL